MSAPLTFVVDYLVNSLWMCPLIAGAAWLMSRVAARAGAGLQHRVWLAALWLEVLLPACSLSLTDLNRVMPHLWPWHRGGDLHDGMVTVITGPAHVRSAVAMSEELGWVLLAAYACASLYFSARLVAGLWLTRSVVHRAVKIDASTSAGYRAIRNGFRFSGNKVAIVESAEVAGPVTVGMWASKIILPQGLLHEVSAGDLEAAMAHECAHVRRHDFAKNLIYRVLHLPLAYHPIAHLTLGRIAETREMVCDAMAKAAIDDNGESYVRSLLRLAALSRAVRPSKTLHAIGILDANTLERRVMRLTKKQLQAGHTLRVGLAAACLAAGVVTCASAMALRLDVAASAANSEQKKDASPMKVPAGVMADNVVYQKPPVYPVDAKANHDTVDGPVVLKAMIGKNGLVQRLVVTQSLRRDYDGAALDAVKDWRYKPYLLNGQPVEVETTITVNYQLEEK